MAIPVLLRLDNAANIYPASLSKHYSSLYRLSVTLDAPVDGMLLQQALETVSRRIPTFRCGLEGGGFWWYLRQLGTEPAVTPLAPLRRFRFEEYGGHLFRVSADGCRIVLDIFHALTDGNGAMTFLLTLTGEYLRLRQGIRIPYGGPVLDPADAPDPAEVEDSFKAVFSGRKGALEKNDDAYHIEGTVLPDEGLRDLRFVLPADRVGDCCHTYGCTVTELMTAAMLCALQECWRFDLKHVRNDVVKVSVPVNLRTRYGSRSLRNFASYINLGVDLRNGLLSFEDMLEAVKAGKADLLRPEILETKIAANVALEENMMVRCIPLFLKKRIIDWVNRLHGDRFYSQTFSNLGMVRLPEPVRRYVREVDFVLGRQRQNSGAVACVGYDGRIFLHLSRKIVENDFERNLYDVFDALGLPVSVSSAVLA